MSDPPPFTPQDLSALKPLQVQEFLSQILEQESVPLAKVQTMQQVYKFDANKNSEIKFRFVQVEL